MRHTITQAAQLAGISRAALYASYINKGLLSINKDQINKPYVETSELLRVFGELKALKEQQPPTMVDTSAHTIALLQQELAHKQSLLDSKDRELVLSNQLILEKDARLLLLDNKLTTDKDNSLHPKRHGLLSFLFGVKP